MEEDKKANIRKEVDKILNKREEKDRLRDAFNLWLKVNPTIDVSYSDGTTDKISARQAYKETVEKIRYLKSQHETSTGLKKSSSTSVGGSDARWRGMLEFPPGSIEFMQMFAVGLLSEDKSVQKKEAINLGKIFPEFVVPEKI